MSWFKVHVNEVLCTGLTNSELGIMLRYKALCEHFGKERLTWQQVTFNFLPKERKIITKLFNIMPEECPDFEQSKSKVSSTQVQNKSKVNLKCVQCKSNVEPIYTQSKSKVSLKSDSKNNDLTYARIDNNINNITKQDKTRQDKIKLHSPQFQKLAERLSEIVQSQKNIKITQSKITSWEKSFEQLFRIEGVYPERISKALEWYSENVGGEYVPVVESGKSFREKFCKLEAAMKRNASQQAIGNSKVDGKLKNDEKCWF